MHQPFAITAPTGMYDIKLASLNHKLRCCDVDGKFGAAQQIENLIRILIPFFHYQGKLGGEL